MDTLERAIAAFIESASALYPSNRADAHARRRACVSRRILGGNEERTEERRDDNREDGTASTHYPAWTIPLVALSAEHDPLRDDAHVFVEHIRAAGGDAQLMHRAVCDFPRDHATPAT
ncbi:hypothetical protein [Paraburkholderia sp.]|uniref:hypothetical protein n=1 Tax=Paraburkholderia sp. TaxID=1926495 RepID=UPI0039E721D6